MFENTFPAQFSCQNRVFCVSNCSLECLDSLKIAVAILFVAICQDIQYGIQDGDRYTEMVIY